MDTCDKVFLFRLCSYLFCMNAIFYLLIVYLLRFTIEYTANIVLKMNISYLFMFILFYETDFKSI